MKSCRARLLLALLGSAAVLACGGARADTMTGALYFNGDTSTNWYDPANGLVPSGDTNASGPTVTLSGGAATFGYQDNDNTDTAVFKPESLEITDVVAAANANSGANGNALPWQQTFTASTGGFFNNLQLISDSFDNGGVTYALGANNKTLTVNWSGTDTSDSTRTFVADFIFSPVPGPIVGAGVPGLMIAGGLIGWLRRKRKPQVAV